jgi:hypothetical protein
MENANLFQGIQDELDGDCREQEAHQARGEFQGQRAQAMRATHCQAKGPVGDDAHHNDGEEQCNVLFNAFGLVQQDERGGNRARPGEHRHGDGRDGDVILARGRAHFLLRFLRSGAFCVEHVESDAEQEDAPGDLERGQRNAEQAEEPLACGGEKYQDTAGHSTRDASRAQLGLHGIARCHGDKGRHQGDGIQNHEHGAEREQTVFNETHGKTVLRRTTR